MSESEIGGSERSTNPRRAVRAERRAGVPSRDWSKLSELTDREELSAAWLSLLSTLIQGVTRGIVLLREDQGEGFIPVAIWPEGAEKLDSLGRAAQKALQAGQPVLLTGEEGTSERPKVAHPLMTDGKSWGVVALEIESRPEDRLRGVILGLQASSGWLRTLDPHGTVTIADEGDEGARLVLEAIASLAEKEGFKAQALGLSIRLEKELQCERVSVGFMKKRRVTTQAVSTSPQFVQKTNLVRSIESAMEEACDQETTIQHPTPVDAPFYASIAHRAHARAYGHRSILSVPFDRNGEIVGAITLERPEGHPFAEEEVLAVEAIAALAGPQLDLSKSEERWIGYKLAYSGKKAVRKILGPRARAVRLALGVVFFAALFVCLKKTDYRVTANAFIEPRTQMIVSAPLEGYVREAPARAGDVVMKGDLLYATDETDLRLEVVRLASEIEQVEKRHLQAMASGSSSEVRILAAQAKQLEAQVDLAKEQLSRSRVLAPIDGVVVSGDLTQAIGSPIERGKPAFTVAPLDGFRIVLKVEDSEIDECEVGQEGVLVLTSMPSKEFSLRVQQVTPISSSEEGMNYFRVEANLEGSVPKDLLRPGMEGVGKVSVGQRPLIWTWLHGTVDWFRMFVWKWSP